jgi:thymidylate synthase ThyX
LATGTATPIASGTFTRTLTGTPTPTFQKKISHTADSQDQRHRATPASRPVLETQVDFSKPDYITPAVIAGTPAANEFFEHTLHETWQSMQKLQDLGVSKEFTMYLLPNAFPIRFEESGDLAGFHHKWVHRLCYTAQEEIWNNCLDEVLQVREKFPAITEHIAAPCMLRKTANQKPYCPEGDRFCGVPVWKLDLKDYRRLI